jgi:diguanylate cyclase (GGDEF)-like protein
MDDGLMVLDEQNRIVDINPAARRLFGIKVGWWFGQQVGTTLASWPELVRRLNTAGNIELELNLDLPDPQYIDLRVSSLYDRNGKFSGRMVILRDITHSKSAEKALQQANQRLQEKLAEIESLQIQLSERAVRDILTGLFNRRYLEETLERELSRAERKGYLVCVIMIDIDHFKKLNDTYGHQAGDLMLHELGEIIKTHTREGDIACRYGGEEFVIVMPDVKPDIAYQRAEDLRLAFQEMHLHYQDNILNSTLSGGVAIFPRDGKTGDHILNSADHALYTAKAEGRNCVRKSFI